MTTQYSANGDDSSPQEPMRSTWALLAGRAVTWRQATEGWAILTTLGAFAVTAGVSFKIARVLRRSR